MAANKNTRSWFRVYRTLFDSDLWLSEPFTVGQAWIDLVGNANFERQERWINGQTYVIDRGQLIVSVRRLSERWHWSKDKVARYLKRLESLKMVSICATASATPSATGSATLVGTLLTIENYEKYQGVRDSKRDSDKDTDKDTNKDTDKDNPKDDIKNFNNNKYNTRTHAREGNVEEPSAQRRGKEKQEFVLVQDESGDWWRYYPKEDRYEFAAESGS